MITLQCPLDGKLMRLSKLVRAPDDLASMILALRVPSLLRIVRDKIARRLNATQSFA
jgi:hypothetical protein